jgi:hypothetical protein
MGRARVQERQRHRQKQERGTAAQHRHEHRPVIHGDLPGIGDCLGRGGEDSTARVRGGANSAAGCGQDPDGAADETGRLPGGKRPA